MTGCSYLFGQKTQLISVRSEPAGAKVIASGSFVGITPTMFVVRRKEILSLEIHKAGYQPQYRQVNHRFTTLGWLDIFPGVLLYGIPTVIGLNSNGAYVHEPSEFLVILYPDKETITKAE